MLVVLLLVARVGWWLGEAGHPHVPSELLAAFWSRCCNTKRHEEVLSFSWSHYLEDHKLRARSFAWLFLILDVDSGFASRCLRWQQWGFHWVALGSHKSSWPGSASRGLG